MTDIEDIVKPFWFKDISESNVQKCFDFITEYYLNKKDINNIKNDFNKYQREHNFNGILKFGSLITIYKIGRIRGIYPNPKPELEEKLKVQNVRENSGVMVFSIFTSAYPSWTKTNPDGTTEIINDYDKSKPENRGEFTCKYNCSFCPKDPGMPKSYIATEPGVARALQNDFDPVKQIFDRALQYVSQGHPIDKIEVILQGGTFNSYSPEYLTEFIRDIYWTFNVFMDWLFYDKFWANLLTDFIEIKGKKLRTKLSLEEEIKINETAPCRVIGLTPETRPDQINYSTIKFFRKIGATRLQLGVQHINDDILRYNNRGCYNKHTIRAIQMLKDNGFKISIHIMLDLPCPTKYIDKMIELDRNMLHEINTNPVYKVDQLKVYPCMVTQHTQIKKWYDEGLYKPYGETIKIDKQKWKNMTSDEKLNFRLSNPLYKTIFDFMKNVHPSVRVERIIRDIPTTEIFGGTTDSGMRSEIDQDMKLIGERSNDIRSREAFNHQNIDQLYKNQMKMKEVIFESSQGKEYFLSWETDEPNSILYSFLRLRLSENSGKTQTGKIIFPELVNCALIRELHTYGKVQPTKENKIYYQNNNLLFEDNNNNIQHKGLAKKLLIRAEEIAISNGYKKIAVIAGVGVREYYRKCGYTIDSEEGCYQIKLLNDLNKLADLDNKTFSNDIVLTLMTMLIVLIGIILYVYWTH